MADHPPQTFEQRVSANAFMAKHGMTRESGRGDNELFGSGVYACTSCLNAQPPARCLLPLLAHLGPKRYAGHACQRCSETGADCSLDGIVMSETAAGGLKLEHPDSDVAPMIQLSLPTPFTQSHIATRSSATTSATATAKSAAATDGATHGLKRMQRLPRTIGDRSRGSTPTLGSALRTRARSKSPNLRTPIKGTSPPLPTPGRSSPPSADSTLSSEGAVSSDLNAETTSPLRPLIPLHIPTEIGNLLELKPASNSNGDSVGELGPPPAPANELRAFVWGGGTHATTTFKRRRLTSSVTGLATSYTLGPALAARSAIPSSGAYATALTEARSEMHSAESAHEVAVAVLARAQHSATVATEAEAFILAEAQRIKEEREAALAHAQACAATLEGMRTEIKTRTLVRVEATQSLTVAQDSAGKAATVLEERVEAYRRVVVGYIVE